ncbi:MAG: family 14 glycosylhydrolase [Deltaproteobacteria bacterium]|nr:family 14 glycosylhydrolase [Deltaproteobacteria bacterium]
MHETTQAATVIPARLSGLPLTLMGPLTIGRLDDPFDPAYEHEWREFRDQVEVVAALGVDAISIDVWWGAVEREDQVFDWRWVERAADEITRAGLMWRPVLAFHRCGGNVGDDCHVPLPSWIWTRYGPGDGLDDPSDLRYRSAQGNESDESVAIWATPIVLEQYREFMTAFRDHFADRALDVQGIAVGLGPASELRLPSYNALDHDAGYPHRGVLQTYSSLAIRDFRAHIQSKYGDLDAVNRAWGTALPSADAILPPDPHDLDAFFAAASHRATTYGRDFFAWQRDSLLQHGSHVLNAAVDVFYAMGSPFHGVRLQARIPGVHWRMTDGRWAELHAGLLSTNDPEWDVEARGYRPLIGALREIRDRPERPDIALEFTCVEKDNDEGGSPAGSRAKDLVAWMATEANRQRVPLGGENALAGPLWHASAWDNIDDVLAHRGVETLTLLRLRDIALNPLGQQRLAAIAARYPAYLPKETGVHRWAGFDRYSNPSLVLGVALADDVLAAREPLYDGSRERVFALIPYARPYQGVRWQKVWLEWYGRRVVDGLAWDVHRSEQAPGTFERTIVERWGVAYGIDMGTSVLWLQSPEDNVVPTTHVFGGL